MALTIPAAARATPAVPEKPVKENMLLVLAQKDMSGKMEVVQQLRPFGVNVQVMQRFVL